MLRASQNTQVGLLENTTESAESSTAPTLRSHTVLHLRRAEAGCLNSIQEKKLHDPHSNNKVTIHHASQTTLPPRFLK